MGRGGRSGLVLFAVSLLSQAYVSVARAAPPETTRTARVSFDVPSESYALYEQVRAEQVRMLKGTARRVSAQKLERLCYSPCDVTLPAGTHTLAVAAKDGDPVVAPPVTLGEGHHDLTLEYTDNSGTRELGRVISMSAGILMGLSGAGAYSQAREGGSKGYLLISGALLGTAGIVVGLVMSLKKDTAVLRVDSGFETDGERWSARDGRTVARAAPTFGAF